MDKERAYKKIDERIKLNVVILRFLLNTFLITLAGTVTLWLNGTLNQNQPFMIVAVITSFVLFIACLFLYSYIHKEINRY